MNHALYFAVATVLLSGLSCSKKNDPGAEIAISVSPESALIVPGKGSSCVARAAAKADSSVPANDIEGNRVTFSRFSLQWRSPDKLTVASIKAKVFSAGISGATGTEGLEITLDEAEIAALLGLTNLTIDYLSPYVTDNPDLARTVDSTATKSGTPYAACGLQLGGLDSIKGFNTYSARIKIELEGFATNCDQKAQDGVTCVDGAQRPVRQSITVHAQRN